MDLHRDTDTAPQPAGVQQGRAACQALLRQALLAPVGRRLALCDLAFTDWPLDEPALLRSLSAWLRLPGRQLVLLAEQPAAMAATHPRFARWRRDFDHAVQVWAPLEAPLPAGLRGLLGEALWLQRLDAADWRLRAISDPSSLQSIHRQLADFLQRCGPGWPVTTLGL